MKLCVGFSRTDSLISKTIRLFLGSNISHTYLRIHDEFLATPLIIHADWNGVEIMHADQFDKENIIIEEFEIIDEKLDVSLRKNLRLLGRRYDYLVLFGWAWTIAVRRWVKKKIEITIDDPKSIFEDPKKIICVDFIIKVLNDSSVVKLRYKNYNPKTLNEWFNLNYSSRGWRKITLDK
jgi:hypothetical protein